MLGERGAEAQLLVTTIYGNIVHLGQGRIAHQLILPVVGSLCLVDVKVVRVTEVTAEGVLLAVAVIRSIQLILNEFVSIQHFLLACQPRELTIGIEINLHLTSLCRFSSNDNYTITTSCTINSGEGSILQYIDTLDIGRRDVVDVVSLESIDDKQRFRVLGT